MAQNRKKGMAKRALSVSLVAAMLATSNTPAWASGFMNENEDGVQAFFNEISEIETVSETAVVADGNSIWKTGDITALEAAIGNLTDWADLTNLNAILTAAKAVKATGANETDAPAVVFVKGGVDVDGKLKTNSTIAGTWDGKSTVKDYLDCTVAVALNSHPTAGGAAATYYAGVNAAKTVDAVDISTAKNKVTAYDVTVNGTTIKNDAADKKIAAAAIYKVNAVTLYLDADKKVAVTVDADAEDIELTAVEDNGNLKLTVDATVRNTFGLTGTYPDSTIAIEKSDDLKEKVTFTTADITYDPNTTVADLVNPTGVIGKNVVMKDLTLTTDYTIELYKNSIGSDKYLSDDKLPVGPVYVGVAGAGATYAGVKVINPTPVNVRAKDLSTLYVNQSVFDSVVLDADIETSIEDALADGVYYEEAEYATNAGVFDLAAEADQLKVTYDVPKEAGKKVVVTITPVAGNKNFTGSKTIRFTPVVDTLPQAVTDAFNTEFAKVNTWVYDAKTHKVNNLLNVDLDVISRSQYEITCADAVNGEIKNAGTYNVVLTVIAGPYKGQKIITGIVEITPAPLTMFASGNGVSCNEVVYDPDVTDAAAVEKNLKPVFTYNGETLRKDIDFDWEVTDTVDGAANTDVTVDLKEIAGANYATYADAIKVATVKKRNLSALNLPEIPVQKYVKDQTWTLAKLLNLKDADGNAVANYEDLIVDGKSKTKLTTANYSVEIQVPATGLGTAKVILKGKGNYTGTVTKEFNIVANDITADLGTVTTSGFKNVIDAQVYDYTKASSKDGITIDFKAAPNTGEFGIRNIADGTYVDPANCDITYTNNKAVGTATVEVKGKTGYNVYAQATFQISPKQLVKGTDVNVAMKDTPAAYDYTGKEIKPAVVITKVGNAPLADGNYLLKEGVDYAVSYKDNIKVGTTAKAIVTGLGNYTFVDAAPATPDTTVNTGATANFEIKKVTIKSANVVSKDVVYAGGLEVTPDITVYNPATGEALTAGADYTVAYTAGGVKAGVATVEITLTTDAKVNYQFDPTSTTISKTFMVNKKALTDCEGTVVDGKPVVKDGEITIPATEYTAVENEDGTFTVTAKADGNYTGTINVAAVVTEAPAATQAKVASKTTSSVKVAWDAVEGAEGYTIWYHSEKDTANTRKIITGGDITSWTHKGLAAGTKYFYTVKAWVKDAEGKYVFGEETSYVRGTTMPMKAKIAKVTANGGMVKVALADEAAGAEKYSMCYSKSSDFASFKVGVRTSYTTRTFTNALTKGTYYVRVKSYRDLNGGKRIYGAWSNTVKVVVK